MQRLEKLIKQRNRQTGGVTVFTAILVLIVLTLMIFYAARVSLFEQRISSNEVRQKTAFHAAEAAIDQGVGYLLENANQVLSAAVDEFPDGNGGLTRDGWFDPAKPRWVACDATNRLLADHPCGGETPMQVGSFFYDDWTTDPGTVPVDSLPLSAGGFAPDVTARLSANICFIQLGAPGTCIAPPANIEEENAAYMIITLLGYGFADCTDTTDVSTCQSAATVAKPIANFKNMSGSPVVPLTTKTTFPPGGTAEVVPNPNAGGIGVPVSVWANDNNTCSDPVAVTGQGSWATCELHEWYGVGAVPAGTACDQPSCSCSIDEAISYNDGTTTHIGIDIVSDITFPCDLFEFYFKVPRLLYETVKNTATILSDCSSLGPESSGVFWISGAECRINANTVIGSPRTPVVIISAASNTNLNGGAVIYGVLYVFDGEDPNAELDVNGSCSIYGAAIVDATMGHYNGTFQIVYASGVLANANGLNGLGAVNGGWRDFGLPDLAW